VEEFEARETRLREERTLSVDEARARFFSSATLGEANGNNSAGPSSGAAGATAAAAAGGASTSTAAAAGGGGNTGRAMVVQPGYLQRGTLRDYQLQGLNWLVYSWSRNENCILADEVRRRIEVLSFFEVFFPVEVGIFFFSSFSFFFPTHILSSPLFLFLSSHHHSRWAWARQSSASRCSATSETSS
jgi:hypothetical protein